MGKQLLAAMKSGSPSIDGEPEKPRCHEGEASTAAGKAATWIARKGSEDEGSEDVRGEARERVRAVGS